MACTLAAIRSIIGFVDNFIQPETSTAEFILDSLFMLGFISLGYGLYSNRIKRVSWVITVIMIILLTLNFLQFGGVLGNSEFNLIGIGVFIILAHGKKTLKFLLPVYFGFCVMAILLVHFETKIYEFFYITTSKSIDDFIYTSACLLVMVIYFKQTMIRESERLVSFKEQLNDEIAKIEEQTALLDAQRIRLNQSTRELSKEFSALTKEVISHDNSLNEYLKHSVDTLESPITNLITNIRKIQPSDIWGRILHDTADELDELQNAIRQNAREN